MTKVRIKYLHVFPDRQGHPRTYFRHQGRRWPLPEPGTPGFWEAYEACLKETEARTVPIAHVAFMPGSLGWCIGQFLASKEFAERAESTKRYSRRLLDELRQRYGSGLICDLEPVHAKDIRNYMKEAHSTSVADVALSLLSNVWQYADEYLDLDLVSDPTKGIRRVHRVTKEHQPWPQDLIDRFTVVAPDNLRIAIKLLLFTGQRKGDVVRMTRACFDGHSIAVKQDKTKVPLIIPCHIELQKELEGLPAGQPFLLVKERGRGPYTPAGLSVAFNRVLRGLGVKGFVTHGLRKNAGAALADAGCSPHEIMAITGHKTLAMVSHYTKNADQKRNARAAISKWESDKKRAANGNPTNE
jgi:integrase